MRTESHVSAQPGQGLVRPACDTHHMPTFTHVPTAVTEQGPSSDQKCGVQGLTSDGNVVPLLWVPGGSSRVPEDMREHISKIREMRI